MRLSYANIMSTVAVFLALGGTSYAALKVTGKNVKDGSLTGKDVKNRSLGARDIKSGVLSGGTGQEGKPGQDATAPAGAVMFFDLAICPAGWSEFTQARGRYVVGLPAGGTLRGTSGSALDDEESRPVGQHTHSATQAAHAHQLPTITGSAGPNAGLEYHTGNSVSLFSALADPPFITVEPAGTVAGTNAPYVQLRACRKS